jgi:hypothetical protein
MKTLLALCAALTFSAVAHAADVAGTWKLEVQTQAGTGTPTLVLLQNGDALTGTYTGRMGESPLTGTTKDATIEFSLELTGPMGGTAKVVYTGTVDGDAMSGSMTMNGNPGGTFTGKRQAP